MRLPEDIRRRLDVPSTAAPIIPYENYVGAILGGQFRLGTLLREDTDGDVYSVTSLDDPLQILEAKAYMLDNLSSSELRTKKRSMKKLEPQRICTIDQAGRKFIVYRFSEQSRKITKVVGTPMVPAHQKPSTLSTLCPSLVEVARKPQPRTYRSQQSPVCNTKQKKRYSSSSRPPLVGPRSILPTAVNVLDGPSERFVDKAVAQVTGTITPPGNVHKQKKNRGVKKLKIPHFNSWSQIDTFQALMSSRLVKLRTVSYLQTEVLRTERQQMTSLRDSEPNTYANWISLSKENPVEAREGLKTLEAKTQRLAITALSAWNQYKSFSSRCNRACGEWETWEVLRDQLEDKLGFWDMYNPDNQTGTSDVLWSLRKHPPTGPHSHWNEKNMAVSFSLLIENGVYDWHDLERKNTIKETEFWRVINGQEKLYRRL